MKLRSSQVLARNDKVLGTIDMGIDQSSLSKLMNILTDLYSDPVTAVVREVTTNACDSHRAAGTDVAVEVEIDEAAAAFIVKDFGVGLSRDDIMRVLSLYGASTKTDSDIETGQLGLGAKAPLSYANSFLMTGVKDGWRTTVDITKNDVGTGTINILDHAETEASNGVVVRVPIANGDVPAFYKALRKLLRFRRETDVPIITPDSTSRDRIPTIQEQFGDGEWAWDDIIWAPTPHFNDASGLDQCYIVMGGVPYPVRSDMQNEGDRSGHWVAWVPMGTVDFTPSREELHYTPQTLEALNNIEATIKERHDDRVTELVTLSDGAYDILSNYFDMIGMGPYINNWSSDWGDYGIDPPTSTTLLTTNNDGRRIWKATVDAANGRGSAQVSELSSLNKPSRFMPAVRGQHMPVRGFPYKSVSAKHRAMLARWLRQNRLRGEREFIIFPDCVEWNGLEDFPFLDWGELEAVKAPVEKRAGNAVTYEARQGGRPRTVWQSDLTSGPHVSPLQHTRLFYSSSHHNALRSEPDDILFVHVSDNRREKFLRLYPEAQHISVLVNEVEAKRSVEWGKVTTVEKAASHRPTWRSGYESYLKEGGTRFKDENLHEFYSFTQDRYREISDIRRGDYSHELRAAYDAIITTKYPLIGEHVYRPGIADIVIYANAKHDIINGMTT